MKEVNSLGEKVKLLENIENGNTGEKNNKENVIGKENLLFQLVGLAAVDAINPCELAVLLILMTAILSRYPKEKKKALKAGLLFSTAIFIMYFIFGVFLTSIFGVISGVLGTLFMIIIAILAIIIGIANLKDGFAYGAGGFAIEVPQRWRPKMKAIIQGTTSPKGAFVVGLIVSFFLTPCTAGPYFIFAGLLAQITIFEALPLLLAYMLIFISPMIGITLITYFGFAKVEDMGEWRENNIKKLHLIAGILMLLIGIWLLLSTSGIL